jgi:hypothetical protein
MYKCQVCGNVTPPRTPAHKITLETRPVFYPHRPKANACWVWRGERRKFVTPDDRGGSGRECAREIVACPGCARRFEGAASGRAVREEAGRLKRTA